MAGRERPRFYSFFAKSSVGRRAQVLAVWLYRKTGGKVGGRIGQAPVCLLTARGRKTGKPRTVPLLYLADGDGLVVVASKGGWDEHPLWYENLRAHPDCEVQIGSELRVMRAEEVEAGDARERYWARVVAMYPGYADYQSWTDRKIPLVRLGPKS